jgi:hypothetical protein
MRALLPTLLALQLLALQLLAPLSAAAGEETFRVELNTTEKAENRCRLNFVIENKSAAAVESMKLDLVLFATDGGILRRLLTELGPLRPAKTMVRAFLVDAECRQIGSILVNEVAACAPGDPNTCLDALAVSSRVKDVRLYK